MVNSTLESRLIEPTPDKLIGDKAYDSDPLDEHLRQDFEIDMVAPHRSNRTKPKTQDGENCADTANVGKSNAFSPDTKF